MEREPVAALREAAGEGVEYDGLTARLSDGNLHLVVEGAETTVDDDSPDVVPDAFVPYVTNWYYWRETAPQRPAERTFLRWLEGATDDADRATVPDRYDALVDGIARTWGELLITTMLTDEDQRRYQVRHIDDRDVPVSDLQTYDDPDDVDAIARRDDRDRYRPLRTAPTLRTGWVFPALEPDALVEVVGAFYPATIENWYREREGDLDVTHYREAAERQTGRYRSVSELPVEALEWAAEACCVDSQCLKRREWDEDGETELDVPRGEGVFPCREPCSLFVAAAREWTELEREGSRTFEFELTPSEKAQLDDLVDAVAEGRVEEIREADLDEGANRYRARYLRAKRFEDGELPATERGEDS
ncbi:DR2241 family protein [Halorhabdus amylolytica]|uniref:DR2241 family protein n=1 Tax=Halorhabdus amylolytica TaxID=2559573 RepID=UPI0010A9FD33|nr:DR2241 family protein [Halorhabdus amylolytica]